MQTLNNENIIITESSKNLRALGRNALNGKWKLASLGILVYVLVTELPPAIFNAIFGENLAENVTSNGYTYGMDIDVYTNLYNNVPEYTWISAVYTLLISGAMSLGITLFFLALFRKYSPNVSDVFLGFEKFGKALGLSLYMSLFVLLWSLLFIVPGIIAAIRYSQAFYILADDPTKGIVQCVNESKAMMRGNKSKYFCLSLSFIGWAFLVGIANSAVSSIGGAIAAGITNTVAADLTVALFAIIGSLFELPLLAYIQSTMAGFYEILAGHLIENTAPAPIKPIISVAREDVQMIDAETIVNEAEPAQANSETNEETNAVVSEEASAEDNADIAVENNADTAETTSDEVKAEDEKEMQ